MERHGIRSYLVGFALAVILSVIPFALVALHALPPSRLLIVIAIAAVLQVLVHLRYFLHLDLATTPRENLLAIAFTAVLIFIMVGGSLWIMIDLQKPRHIASVRLIWEKAHGREYEIQVSDDAKNWKKVYYTADFNF